MITYLTKHRLVGAGDYGASPTLRLALMTPASSISMDFCARICYTANLGEEVWGFEEMGEEKQRKGVTAFEQEIVDGRDWSWPETFLDNLNIFEGG